MHSNSKEARSEGVAEVRRLFHAGQPLQAYEQVKARGLGDLHRWQQVDERVLAGRLLTPLGGGRLSDVLYYTAFRSNPQHADAALYLAKSSDGRIGVFDEDLRAKIGRRASIEQRLGAALAAGELEVHYQPVLRSDSLVVGQVEALVRWIGEDTYGPDVFIPVAEKSDLVVKIDRFVMHTATTELAALLSEGLVRDLSVAVNVSGRHLLHADVVAHVAEALAVSGLDPSRLIIEVTETALIADLDRAGAHLSALRSMGVRVSVDDFGTGFTSISQLRRLPIDELKIDRSLVADLPGDETLVRVVRDLAEHFGMTTVAEGVETQEQADFLGNLGCSQLQGWLYARAMPADDLRRWFANRSSVRETNRVVGNDLA